MKKRIPSVDLTVLFTIKDLARAAQVHPSTIRRWCRRTGLPPTWHWPAVARWTAADAQRLFRAVKQRKFMLDRPAA